MVRKIFCAAFFLFFIGSGYAQQNKEPAPQAVRAYANGDDSYLAFSTGKYKAGKKYVVFKIWNESAPLSEAEKNDLVVLKEALSRKGVELRMVEWKTEADLKAAFAPYKIKASVADGKHIRLQSGNSQLNTTSANALYVVENDKPVSLCSGTNCEDRVKFFFGLKALN